MEFEIDGDISDFDIKLPTKKLNIIDDNALFNKAKISTDILSMSDSNSIADIKDIHNADQSASDSDDNESVYGPNDMDYRNRVHNISTNGNNNNYNGTHQQNYRGQSYQEDMIEKKEILYQLDRLRSKGVKVPFDFNMNSDLNEMRNSFQRLKREREIDASVRFQRKMMMGFVTGAEFLNSRYDPLAIELDGWSEQVHENIDDYDDIFEELHEKYKATGSDMAPELRLMISLGGSAFMFHLTKRMFSNTKLPKVEEVLKNNPDLMRQFQEASAMEYMNGARPQTQSTRQNQRPSNESGAGNDLFGMVSSLFNTGNDASLNPTADVDNIINNVHSQINIKPGMDDNMMETLTVTDEEITSLIEDTADIKLLDGNKKKSRKSTNTTNSGKRVLSL